MGEKKEDVMEKKHQKIELSSEDKEIVRKQTKRLIIMGGILVILIAVYFILSAISKKNAAKAENAEEEGNFLTTDAESVTEFSFTYNGEKYEFKKSGEDWIYTGDESMDMDEDLVGALVENLASISYSVMLEEAADLDQYGLLSGYETVQWKNADGSFEIRIGSSNPISGEYYIQDAGNGDICLVNSSFVTKYRTTPGELEYFEAGSEE